MRFLSSPFPLRRIGPRPLVLAALLLAGAALTGCATLTGAAGPTPTSTATSGPAATPTTAPASNGGKGDKSYPGPTGGSFASLPSIADLVELVEPAVVNIVVQTTQQTFFGAAQRSTSSGSGVIFREDGYILTNNHVVQGADDIRVTLNDTSEFEATVVGTDPATDLAVIKIEKKELPRLSFANIANLRVGDWVVAIGNAAGLEGKPSVTLGIVSALDRSLDTDSAPLNDLIQTDAVINPGNSGGPLLNLAGEVVGINTVILRGSQLDGIGFAISADTVSLVADQLVRNGRVIWPRMGVGVLNIGQPTAVRLNLSVRDGALVSQVETGGPAEKAGLRLNDVIVALDGMATPDVRTLLHLLRSQYKVGQKAALTIVRGKDRQDLTITLAESQR